LSDLMVVVCNLISFPGLIGLRIVLQDVCDFVHPTHAITIAVNGDLATPRICERLVVRQEGESSARKKSRRTPHPTPGQDDNEHKSANDAEIVIAHPGLGCSAMRAQREQQGAHQDGDASSSARSSKKLRTRRTCAARMPALLRTKN
jgi:hypothetical protein